MMRKPIAAFQKPTTDQGSVTANSARTIQSTTPNPPAEADRRLFERLGLRLQVREPAPVASDGPHA